MLGHKENVHLINGQWMDDFSTVSYCFCMQHCLGTNNFLFTYVDIYIIYIIIIIIYNRYMKRRDKLKQTILKSRLKTLYHLKMHYNFLIVLLLD